MKYLYITSLCCLLTIAASAQRRPAGKPGEPGITTYLTSYSHSGIPDSVLQGWRISTNLVSLVAPDGGISLAGEYRFDNHWSVLTEATWIFIDSKNAFDIRGRYTPKAKGYAIRPEVRYYLTGKRSRYRMFFAQEISYKKVNFLEERIQQIGLDQWGHYDYEQITPYEKTKQVYSTASKFGAQFLIGPEHRILLEGFIGLGVKYKDYAYTHQPPATSYLEDKDYSFDEAKNQRYAWTAAVPMAIKIGYRF